jgi:IS4 transposase
MISTIFEQFVEASPVTVMVRAIMERIFRAEKLDELFEQSAQKQYTRTLLFSTVVGLMSLVVCGIHPTVGAAYKALEKLVGVSRVALYDKLNGLGPGISRALVDYSGKELAPLVKALGGSGAPLLPGYEMRIVDGNHLGGTEHRLAVLQDQRAGALPGQSIAILDPESMLVLDLICCEDAHAQERSLCPQVLSTVKPGEVWIGDRNFCTRSVLFGIDQRQAYLIIREHLNLPQQALEPLHSVGVSSTGTVFEQAIEITDEQGNSLQLRRIVVQLKQPTRHGDTQVVILTQLPTAVADALTVATLYLERWSVEGMFQVITDVFHCELKTLGYPRAALFVFAMAVVAFNILSTLKTALKAVHGVGKIEAGLSDFYLVEEVQGTFRGMMIALPAPLWQPWADLTVEAFAETLKQWATNVDLKRFSSAPRGPKKAKTKGIYDPKHPHVSTARLLQQKENKRSP